jgi:2,4-dienoyl-CoA reductase-like NADH-dependent reductase (Old Yellow Enzyme family)
MLRTPALFREHLNGLGIEIPFDEQIETGPDAPLAQPYRLANGFTVGNRFCVLPMEGWDGTADGHPSELTFRRWERFGLSGAKLIFGGEATAVRHDGRANPNQLIINEETLPDLVRLRETLISAHTSSFGASSASDLYVGLQLTHSGRFCRPNGNKLEPTILYRHPVLDRKFGLAADYPVMTDDQIDRLIEDFAAAAVRAQRAGYQFVDVKHCHGYLGHEFLSAVDRPGKYGGSFENRTRFLRNAVAAIRAAAPGLDIAVRLSAFDFVPFRPGPDSTGVPETWGEGSYRWAFGGDGTGQGIDLAEPKAFLDLLAVLGIALVCITGGSPYYVPHIQRPALFPPSDGYEPPEDPLIGVARQVAVTTELKRHRPDLAVIGSGYSYLQEWLPNVGQHIVRTGMADFIGLGRMVLAYPEMAADALAGRALQRKRICRTFSDCTTAPRNHMVSGCYPLDEFYKARPEAETLAKYKRPDRE